MWGKGCVLTFLNAWFSSAEGAASEHAPRECIIENQLELGHFKRTNYVSQRLVVITIQNGSKFT